jgi:hypothetical protein
MALEDDLLDLLQPALRRSQMPGGLSYLIGLCVWMAMDRQITRRAFLAMPMERWKTISSNPCGQRQESRATFLPPRRIKVYNPLDKMIQLARMTLVSFGAGVSASRWAHRHWSFCGAHAGPPYRGQVWTH